jgi:hypothetical protein
MAGDFSRAPAGVPLPCAWLGWIIYKARQRKGLQD